MTDKIALPPGWQLIGGLPVHEDGDWCVIANRCRTSTELGNFRLYHQGVYVTCGHSKPAFSHQHFSDAEESLNRYKREHEAKSIRESYRSDRCTVFVREDGVWAYVFDHHTGEGNWQAQLTGCTRFCCTRKEAEAVARKWLTEANR